MRQFFCAKFLDRWHRLWYTYHKPTKPIGIVTFIKTKRTMICFDTF